MRLAAALWLACSGTIARADQRPVHPSVDVAPRVVEFDPHEVGNPVADSGVVVTFTNSSRADGSAVKFSAPAISPNFAIVGNECIGEFKPAASCSITVAFAPTTGGSQRGTLQLVSNAVNSPHIVKLRGRGIATPLDFEKKLNFGAVKLDASTHSMQLTLTNHGQEPIKFSSIAASPPFNVIANSCETLEPKGNCQVQVEFAPGLAGTFKGLLELRDSAAKSPQHVKLVGVAN